MIDPTQKQCIFLFLLTSLRFLIAFTLVKTKASKLSGLTNSVSTEEIFKVGK